MFIFSENKANETKEVTRENHKVNLHIAQACSCINLILLILDLCFGNVSL
jgi:hypothetical protein